VAHIIRNTATTNQEYHMASEMLQFMQ